MPKCLRCDHDWPSRIDEPKCCPACKSYRWSTQPSANQATGRPQSPLTITILALEPGQTFEDTALVVGRDLDAVATWTRRVRSIASRYGRSVEVDVATSGRHPRATRVS